MLVVRDLLFGDNVDLRIAACECLALLAEYRSSVSSLVDVGMDTSAFFGVEERLQVHNIYIESSFSLSA